MDRAIWGLVIFALLVRTLALITVPGALVEDIDLYRTIAENLLREGSFSLGGHPTAFRPPVYPMLLVPCVALGKFAWWGIAGLHLTLGVATAIVVFLLVRTLGGGQRSAWLAGALVVVDPILVWQSTRIMTETAVVFFVVASMWAGLGAIAGSGNRWAIVSGLFAGIAALTRANLLPWAVLLPVFVACGYAVGKAVGIRENRDTGVGICTPSQWCFGSLFRVVPLRLLLLGYIGFLIPVGAWATRNWLVLGHWVFGTTHGGITFYLANNDFFYDHLSAGLPAEDWDSAEFREHWHRQVESWAGLDEVAANHLAYAQAWDVIRSRPGMFFRSIAIRALWLWDPFPNPQALLGGGQTPAGERFSRTTWKVVVMFPVGVFYVALYAAAFLGGWRVLRARQEKGLGWFFVGLGICLIVILTAVHAVYWSNIRMRAPSVPVLCVLAAFGVEGLLGRLRLQKTAVNLP